MDREMVTTRSRYRVLRESLSYPGDVATVDALTRAADLPSEARDAIVRDAFEAGRMRLAIVGDVVDDIPAVSLPWLLEQGYIARVGDVTEAVTPADVEEALTDLGRPDDADHEG